MFVAPALHVCRSITMLLMDLHFMLIYLTGSIFHSCLACTPLAWSQTTMHVSSQVNQVCEFLGNLGANELPACRHIY